MIQDLYRLVKYVSLPSERFCAFNADLYKCFADL